MAEGSGGFSEVERAAIKERAAELRAEKGGKKAAAALEDLLKSIAAMPDDQRIIAERVHAIVSEAAPALLPKTWYGPGVDQRRWQGGGVLSLRCEVRHSLQHAWIRRGGAARRRRDVGSSSHAITGPLGAAEEKKIAQLVNKAAG